ncbi:hypothetical protein L7F22_032320 [Adiantum nelumboides]|nr:hypothetical protein [Adiantum nelumboides]
MRMPNVTAGHDDVDGHSSGSEHSLDEELGIPSLRTPTVRRLHAQNGVPGSNAESRSSERNRYPVDRLMYDGYVAKHFAFMAKVAQDVEPTCFENDKWQEAMNEEMDALYGNETWELALLPKGKKPIGCRWVYKVKHNSDGSVSRYKGGLVAKEYAQTYGIDYEETFASIAKMAIVRAVIAVVVAKGWILHQMDVKNAFLHCDLQEEVNMEQPPSYQDTGHPDYVCKLWKALYGLKQAPRAWHDKIAQSFVLCAENKCRDCDHYHLYTQVQVHGYTDFDWAGSVSDRRSTSGYMFSFGSVAVTWSSKKQPTVALSSTKAEYRGAAVAACEVAWLKMLL